MKTTTQLHSEISDAELMLENTVKHYKQAKKALIGYEDDIIVRREVIRKLREELECVAFKETTVIEQAEKEAEVAAFKSRIAEVSARLEKAGKNTIRRPIEDWVRDNMHAAIKLKDHYVALAFYKGVLVASKDRDKFSISLANMDPSMRSVIHIFYMNDYIGDAIALKAKMVAWLGHNRSRMLSVQSFKEAASVIAREVFGHKEPDERQLETIEMLLHGDRCGCAVAT